MSQSYRVVSYLPGRLAARRIVVGMLAVGIASLAQGCSSAREPGYGTGSSRLWGKDRSAYDADAPLPAQPYASYGGGRDVSPVPRQDWPPAAPVERSRYDTPAPIEPYRHETAAPYRAPYGHAAPPPHAAPQAPGGRPYTVEVREGDTLYHIARAHNVTMASLMQANGLSFTNNIRVGDRLMIPGR